MFDLDCGLRLREFRPPPSSDIDDIISMYNDAQVAPLINDGFAVPRGQKFKDAFQSSIDSPSVEIFCMIETIPSTSSSAGEPVLPQFVGIVGLWSLGEKGNRHATFSISLMPQFWSKGYGTEVTKFIVNHAFVQMNMHRISLQVYDGNERAISLYKKMSVFLFSSSAFVF